MPCKLQRRELLSYFKYYSVKNHEIYFACQQFCLAYSENQSEEKGLELAKKFIMGLAPLFCFFSLGLDTENTSILQKDAPVRKFSHNSSLPFDKDGRRKKSNAVVE